MTTKREHKAAKRARKKTRRRKKKGRYCLILAGHGGNVVRAMTALRRIDVMYSEARLQQLKKIVELSEIRRMLLLRGLSLAAANTHLNNFKQRAPRALVTVEKEKAHG